MSTRAPARESAAGAGSTPVDFRRTLVTDFMSSPVVAVTENASLGVAVAAFQRTGLRHLAVITSDGGCAGLISHDSVIPGWWAPASAAMTVGDMVGRAELRVDPDVPVSQVAKLMLDEAVDAIPVVTETGRLVGVVTWSDLLRLLTGNRGPLPGQRDAEVPQA